VEAGGQDGHKIAIIHRPAAPGKGCRAGGSGCGLKSTINYGFFHARAVTGNIEMRNFVQP
jgi:hypothetical protein